MHANTTSGHRILIVDDDVALRDTVARQMRRCGHFVEIADSAEAALACCDVSAPFDVVITDVHLPLMNGIDMATILLAHRPVQRVIIVTGDADPALAEHAIGLGPVAYLLKPFEMFELESLVNQALVFRGYKLAV